MTLVLRRQSLPGRPYGHPEQIERHLSAAAVSFGAASGFRTFAPGGTAFASKGRLPLEAGVAMSTGGGGMGGYSNDRCDRQTLGAKAGGGGLGGNDMERGLKTTGAPLGTPIRASPTAEANEDVFERPRVSIVFALIGGTCGGRGSLFPCASKCFWRVPSSAM